MESDPTVSFFIAGLVFTFLLSALFSIVKIVFNSVANGVIPPEDEHLRYYALQVERIFKNQPLLNSNVSFGRIFSNTGFAILCFMFLDHLFPDMVYYKLIGISLSVTLIVLSLFSYEIPRAFAMRFYRNYFSITFIAYNLFGLIFLPGSKLFLSIHKLFLRILKYDEKFSFLSDKDKARIIEQNDTESLNEDEKEMIQSIFDLGDTTVDEIMIPRIDIKGLDIDSDIQSVLKIIKEEGHSRFPVYKDNIDSIIGILYAKDILSWLAENDIDKLKLKDVVKKPHYVPIGKKVNDLMKEFKVKHIHLAIIVDEYGGTAGIVSMEDILEEIVGDIQDEFDEDEKEVVQISNNIYVIDPHIDLYDLNEELDVNLEIEEVDYTTLSGLIYHEYGDVPQEGTVFEYNGLRISVIKMDNQRIEKVKVEVLQRPANSVEVDTF